MPLDRREGSTARDGRSNRVLELCSGTHLGPYWGFAPNRQSGKHDYSGFCSIKSDVEDMRRTVYAFDVWREGDMVYFKVSADGFLYNMVRIMVGTLLFVSEGKIKKSELVQIINSKDRKRAGKTAPPQGLYLNKVNY